MRRLLSTFCLFAVAAHAAIIVQNVTLSGSQEFPSNASPGTGTATVTYDTVTNILGVTVNFSNLTGNTTPVAGTPAHLHGPATQGANAGIILGFPGFPAGVMSGVYNNANVGMLTDQQEQSFLNGLTYINIHTTAFGGGEIRAQIVPEPGTVALVALGLAGLAIARKRRA